MTGSCSSESQNLLSLCVCTSPKRISQKNFEEEVWVVIPLVDERGWRRGGGDSRNDSNMSWVKKSENPQTKKRPRLLYSLPILSLLVVFSKFSFFFSGLVRTLFRSE